MQDVTRDREHYTIRLDGGIKTALQLFAAFETINLGASGIDRWNVFFDYLWDRITFSHIRVVVEISEDFQLPPQDASEFQWVMTNISAADRGEIVFTTYHN